MYARGRAASESDNFRLQLFSKYMRKYLLYSLYPPQCSFENGKKLYLYTFKIKSIREIEFFIFKRQDKTIT